MDRKEIRVYLKAQKIATPMSVLDPFKTQRAKVVGKGATKMIYCIVSFEIIEVSLLIDMGQGVGAVSVGFHPFHSIF